MIKKVRADQVKKNDFIQVSKYFARKTGKVFHEVVGSDYRWFKIELTLKDVDRVYTLNRKLRVLVDRVDIEKEVLESRERAMKSEMGRYFNFVEPFKKHVSWVCDCMNINVWLEKKCTCGAKKPLITRTR